ncbi:hypothetical protein ACN6LA_006979 [Streptomyces sp. SAS_269]|uniref:hypothetical protein n=1 Tax=Streptomyces sp. SAS_269 TaxID=3412749 RepID=UPI00403C6BC7
MDGDKVAVRSVLYGTTGDAPDTASTMREIFRVTFGAGRRTRPRFRPSAPMERSLSPSGGGLRHFLGTREEMLYRAPDVIEGIKNGSLGPMHPQDPAADGSPSGTPVAGQTPGDRQDPPLAGRPFSALTQQSHATFPVFPTRTTSYATLENS